MAMNCPVAAEQQDHIGSVARDRHPHPPFDIVGGPALVRLKGFKILLRTPQPEDGGRAHVRGETSRIVRSKLRMRGQPSWRLPVSSAANTANVNHLVNM